MSFIWDRVLYTFVSFQLHLQLKACAAQAQDYENTILKFRQKTSDLQEEIQDLKDQVRLVYK